MNVQIIKIESANANPTLCVPCGGKCCQQAPGAVLPMDLMPDNDETKLEERIQQLLMTGRYAIDWWEGSPFSSVKRGSQYRQGYYLRPATKGKEGQVYDASWGGACTFHSSVGCELPDESRPGECKLLIPKPSQQCGYAKDWEGKRTVAQLWWPYRFLLGEVDVEAIEDAQLGSMA